MATTPGLTVIPNGLVADLASSAGRQPDNTGVPGRVNARGEGIVNNVWNGMQQAAVEGTYVSMVNAGTRGTGTTLTSATGTTYAATQALMVIANVNPPGGPSIVLDYFKLLIDTVPGGGTFWQIYHALDQGNRYASAGTTMPANAINGASGVAAGVVAYSGAVVASAATGNVRDIGHNIILNGVGVANMELVIKYGQADGPQGTFTTPTTGVAQSVFSAPPVVIPPGWSYVMNEFQTARSASGTVGEIYVGAIIR